MARASLPETPRRKRRQQLTYSLRRTIVKVMHVDASAKRERSNSRALSRYFLECLRAEGVDPTIDYLDVMVDTPPHVTTLQATAYSSLTIFLARKMDDGLMLSSSTPRPISTGIISGRAAASPQTATPMPAFLAAAQTIPIARSTAG